MSQPGRNDTDRQTAADAAPALLEALVRISGSLEFDTLLREIVGSARTLTGARYGVIATVDEHGEPDGFVSSGLTPEEHERLAAWPDGPALFDHLRDLDAPLRLDSLTTYVRSLGFAAELMPAETFQGTPMRHRGLHVGNFYLAGKASGGFTAGDEKILMLFAAQAGAAIANARALRDERRARADLEALVETSPVGVAVLDVRTGLPKVFNREARRLVEGLCFPDRSLADLLKVLRYRYADGREIRLDEVPLAATLRDAEAIRAEEMELSVADGRRVAVLVNATPIRTEAGTVESVVATMQDLAPLAELQRLRAEFLGMVSHELRAPLAAIKGSATTALGARPALEAAEMREFFRIIDEQADQMRHLIGDLLDAGRIEAGTLTVAPRPTDLLDLVEQARNTFLGAGRHTVQIDLPSSLPRVMGDDRRIVQVLNNLLANAARHSPPAAPILVTAATAGTYVSVSVADQGAGLARDALARLFRRHAGIGGPRPGGEGYGLGLAICKGIVEAHGGRIRADSAGPGQGMRVTFTLPAAESDADAARRPAAGAPPDSQPAQILVVDDDPQTLRYVRDALATAGYEPLVTGDPAEMVRIIRIHKPRLVLLDLILPGADGIELLETVPELAGLPVIFISGYGRDETVARALESGAVDYIVKPFSPTELIARVRAALRGGESEPFVLRDLVVDYGRRRATLRDEPLHLTATEFDVLRALASNGDRVTTYETLLRDVWARRPDGDPELVRTVIKKLRQKMGDPAGDPAYIVNARGVGYRMAAPDLR